MISRILVLMIVFIFPLLAIAEKGVVTIESEYSVEVTSERFESIIKAKKFTVFSRIDHQKNATNVNLKIRPSTLILFGNPKVGTKLIQCAQSVAIDLPQKVLVWADSDDKVWLSYNDPEFIAERHNIQGCDMLINRISKVLSKLSLAATKK